jgi:hypothetical protein
LAHVTRTTNNVHGHFSLPGMFFLAPVVVASGVLSQCSTVVFSPHDRPEEATVFFQAKEIVR